MISSALSVGPRLRFFVQAAITREARARRIVQKRTPTSHTIQLTENGLRFFRRWGVTTLHSAGSASLKRLTVIQIRRQSAMLRGVITKVRDVVKEYCPDNGSVYTVENVVSNLHRAFVRIDRGAQQTTQLHQEHAAARAEERQLTRRVGELRGLVDRRRVV
ncbi:hypothetical protein FKP32DRAFT_1679353 [Trametes sanguinea]|nr:hypothetical protein FKP32DRAFT_1679353 [Trametes sanguinea]